MGRTNEMRRAYRKKMAAVLLSVTVTAGCIFTGCGKKSVDYNVDETGGSGDSGSVQRSLDIPESCEESLSVGDSGLSKIAIDDSEVTAPDTSNMVIAYLDKTEAITNEDKKEVAESLFETDQGIYAYDYDNQTKADIQSQIDQYEAEKASMEEGTSVSIDGMTYDELIAELEDQLASAPDEYPAAGDYSGEYFIGTYNGTEYELCCYVDTNSFYFSLKGDMLSYRPKDGVSAADCYYTSYENYVQYGDDGTLSSEEANNQCTYTEEEAQSIAEEFLSGVGVTDVILTDTDNLCWVYENGNFEMLAADVEGYQFTFARAINGQPVSALQVWSVDNLSMVDATVSLLTETYSVSVDSNGVISAEWVKTSYEVSGTEPASLLSFDGILEKANENVAAYYTQYPTNYKKVEFNDITLSYFLKSDDDGSISYVPAWILSEYEEYTDYSNEEYPTQLVVIDATDGSVVDLVALSKALGTYYPYSDEEDVSDENDLSDEEDASDGEDTTDGEDTSDEEAASGEEDTSAE